MAAKTPKKFRQARKAAKVDAKKAFSGKRQAGLKDKNPLMKFSEDDKKALSEVREEARKGYITDDKGNKIRVKPTETSLERIARDRREAKAELERRWAIEDGKEKVRESKPATKPAPKITEAGKVRSAVTAPEPKPQGYKIDPKTGRKIQAPKIINKSTPTKGGRVVRIQEPRVRATKPPVVKKGFAVGKQLNAEGKAIYDRLIKEGVKPKSALNKALFRQEKAATAAAKAAGPVASAAKSAAAAVKKQGPIKVPSTVVSSKPNVPGKELAVRPKAGAVATKAATTSAKKKLTAKTAALGAAKFAGKAVTGKVGMAVTAASLLAGPIQRKLSEGTKGRTTYDNLNAIAERSKKEGTVYTRSGDKPMNNASYGRAVPGAGGATIASVPKANAAPRKETQKLRGPVKRTSATGPTMDYKVETGDTLSAIAKRSGITLSELMALNKKIKDPRKIYRNTNIKIPSAGKVPDPMYTGPVPYRPGSKEAKAYEALRASRKK